MAAEGQEEHRTFRVKLLKYIEGSTLKG